LRTVKCDLKTQEQVCLFEKRKISVNYYSGKKKKDTEKKEREKQEQTESEE